jgi:CRISPR-associated endonuclease Cas3-HD
LVRHDDSVTVIVHSNPEALTGPYDVEGFSLFHGTVRSWMRQAPAGLPWFIKGAFESERHGDGELSGVAPTWQWQEIRDPQAIVSGMVLAVHPAAVTYDDVGLQFKPSSHEWHSPKSTIQPRKHERYSYRVETYEEHVRRVVQAYERSHCQLIACVASRFQPHRWPQGALDKACRVAIALHDAGKLTVDWQNWAHAWQASQGKPVPETVLLAHTDFDPDRDSERQRGLGLRRPNHAVEGAAAVYPWLKEILPAPLDTVVWSAIARHHAPLAASGSPFVLHKAAEETLRAALRIAGVETKINQPLYTPSRPIALETHLLPKELDIGFLAYSLVVRVLRLSDWAGTAA